MSEIHVTDYQGVSKTIEYDSPSNLMELLKEADYEEVAAICGGSCSCATCHVWLNDPDQAAALFPDKESTESDLLELVDDFDKHKSRLSCQLTLEDHHSGLEIRLHKEGF